MTANRTNRNILEGAFSTEIVDALDGRMAEVADERIELALDRLRSEVTRLVTTQRGIREQAQSLPEEQRREVQPEVDAASRQTDKARQATNDLRARSDAGEEVSEEEVTAVRQQSDEAAAAQQRASERVESVSQTDTTDQPAEGPRLTRARSIREESERQPTPPAPRQPQDSTDGDVFGRLERVERDVRDHGRRLDDHDTVIAHVFSEARAAYHASNVWQRAGMIAIVAFVVTFLIYCLVWVLTDMDWQGENAFAIPAIVAGIVGALYFAFNSESGVYYQSYETARSDALTSRDQRDAEEYRRQQRSRSHQREAHHDESDSSQQTRALTGGQH